MKTTNGFFHKKPVIQLLFSLFSCLILCSCESKQLPVIIGLCINLSGPGGGAGEHIRNGALLAVQDINKAGGIKGRPIELLVRDDQGSGAEAVEEDRKLIAAGVPVIVGHSISSTTMAAYPVVTAQNILLFTAYSATTKLTGKQDLFFRTCVDCELYGKKTAKLLNKRGIRSVAFLMDMTNPDFVNDYYWATVRHFRHAASAVKFSQDNGGDWDSIMSKLLENRPDAIILLTEATMTGVALQKLRARGYSGLRLATLWAQTPELFRYAAGAAEGLSVITFIRPSIDSPQFRMFQYEMQREFHEAANARSARSYELMMILAQAMNQAQKLTGVDIAKALQSKTFDGLLGKVTFDRFGDVVRPVYELTVKEGRFKIIGEI